jgi:hypothetical protein
MLETRSSLSVIVGLLIINVNCGVTSRPHICLIHIPSFMSCLITLASSWKRFSQPANAKFARCKFCCVLPKIS